MKKCWTDSDAHMYILSNKCNTNKKASELLYSGISDSTAITFQTEDHMNCHTRSQQMFI